ncbi:MAG: adenosylmethionine--8-amino-7-oxononanoate transaminase [Nonlabens sp.]
MTKKQLLELDAQNIWHPLTQHKTALPPKAIAEAKGNYLYDFEGKTYFDAISSWYTCSYGHANPKLTDAIKRQVDKLHHVVFAGMTHEPAVALSEKLLKILPYNQSKLFFSENGSTSVEIALKMAFQLHYNRGERRNVVVALENGFHGDTFGAMSTSGLSVYNGAFEDFFIEVVRIPAPTLDNIEAVLSQVDQILEGHEVASFIYEPLVQGAAAMQLNDANAMCRLLLRFRESGVLNIADEVMTGFGKTGTYFASDQITNEPDIICLSKALTGGIMPMAITSCTEGVYQAFYDSDIKKGLFHGHTYSGNPLGCAVANAAIDLLTSDAIQNNIKGIIGSHETFVAGLKSHRRVLKVRHQGVILAMDVDLDMNRYGSKRDEIFEWFWERGIFLRPLGNTIYMAPPFTSTKEELDRLYGLFERFLEEFE